MDWIKDLWEISKDLYYRITLKHVYLSDLVENPKERLIRNLKNLLKNNIGIVFSCTIFFFATLNLFFKKKYCSFYIEYSYLSFLENSERNIVLIILATLISGFIVFIGQSFYQKDRYSILKILYNNFNLKFNLSAIVLLLIYYLLGGEKSLVYFLSIPLLGYLFFKIIKVFKIMRNEKRILKEKLEIIKNEIKEYLIPYCIGIKSSSILYKEIEKISKENFEKIKVDQVIEKKSYPINSKKEGYLKDVNFTKIKDLMLDLDSRLLNDNFSIKSKKNDILPSYPPYFICDLYKLSIGCEIYKSDNFFSIDKKLYDNMKNIFSNKQFLDFKKSLLRCIKIRGIKDTETLLSFDLIEKKMNKAIEKNSLTEVKFLTENEYRPVLSMFSEVLSSNEPLIKELREKIETEQIIFWQREIYFSEFFLDFIKYSINIESLGIAEELIKKSFLFFKDAIKSNDLILFKTFFIFFSRLYDLSYSKEREYDQKTRDKIREIIRKNILSDVKWIFFDLQKITDIKRFQLFLIHILSTLSFIIKMSFDQRDKKSSDIFMETFSKCKLDDDFSESSEEKRFLKEKKEHYLFNLCAYRLTDPKSDDAKKEPANNIPFDEKKYWEELSVYFCSKFIEIYQRYKKDKNQREIDERDQDFKKSQKGAYRPSSRDMATDYLIYKILDLNLEEGILSKEIDCLSTDNINLILNAIKNNSDNPPKKLENKIKEKEENFNVLKSVLEEKREKKEKEIKESKIDENKVNKFKEDFLKDYENHKNRYNIFSNIGLYKSAKKIDGLDHIESKRLFHKRNFIDGSVEEVPTNGNGLSSYEIKYVFEEIRGSIKNKPKIKKDQLIGELTKISKRNNKLFFIAGQGAYEFLLKEGRINSRRISGDQIHAEGKKFDIYKNSDLKDFYNKILILHKEKIGKIIEYKPTKKTGNLLDYGISLDIHNLSKRPDLLEQGREQDYSDEYLYKNVMIEVKKSFKFKKNNNLWGYEITIEDIKGSFYNTFLDE